MAGLMFKWILRQGGLAAIHARNMEKAALIYDAVDQSGGFYKGHARPDSRSLMNLTFKTRTEALDDAFVKEAQKQGMDQLKGHRSTGGVRASTYNAMPAAGCKALADFMRDFARKNG
jgi:phosphoserine aminotransferase